MGCYFGFPPGAVLYSPTAFSFFDVYIYLHNADYYVTAVEYQLVTPDDPTHVFFSYSAEIVYPDNMSIIDGDPFNGHSIAYWPPLNGYVPGYNMICKLECFTTEDCWDNGGTLADYDLVIGPHPDSGELRGTYHPDMLPFPIFGLTSFLCPQEMVGVEEESWGAIKSLYR
jgi:hypothetical protein